VSVAYVLDKDTRAPVGQIDQSYTELTTFRRYQAMDTFEMKIDAKRLYAAEVVEGRFIYLPDNLDQVYVVEQILREEGADNPETMVVSGRSLEGPVLAERLCYPPAGESHDRQIGVAAETAIKHYVYANAGLGADAARRIPNLVIAADLARGGLVNVEARYQPVADIIREIALKAGLGYQITFDGATRTFVFDVVVGVDRSDEVFFDFKFDTLEHAERLVDISDSKTHVTVAGQGEGADREIVERDLGAPAGFDRREAFVDARDVEPGETDVLEHRGDAYLAAAGPERRMEAKPHQHGSFKYAEHYYLGDLVLVRDEVLDLSYADRVVEVHESVGARTVTAVLGRPFPTISERVQGSGPKGGVVDLVKAKNRDWYSALDYGAKGGAYDDTDALEDAIAAAGAAGGGIVFLPLLHFISRTLFVPSNVTLMGAGWGTGLKALDASWTGSVGVAQNAMVANENWDAGLTVIVDENIVLEDMLLDYGDVGPNGNYHLVHMRSASRVRVTRCKFEVRGNGDAVAGLHVDDFAVEDSDAYGFSNCGWDFWEESTDCSVIDTYLETASTAQMVNFNPEAAVTSTESTGFVMRGNLMVYGGSTSAACMLGPLGTGTTGKDYVVTENQFVNVGLVVRGAINKVTVTDNQFENVDGIPAVLCGEFGGSYPETVIVTGNMVKSPTVDLAYAGVIHVDADNAIIANNACEGSDNVVPFIYHNVKKPTIHGNRSDTATVVDEEPNPDRGGTWTPAFVNSGGNYGTGGSMTAVAGAVGRWWRKGNKVEFYISVSGTLVLGTGPSGTIRVSGLPFTVSNDGALIPVAGSLTTVNKSGGTYTQVSPRCHNGTTEVSFSIAGPNLALAAVNVADLVAGTVTARVSGHYYTTDAW
jgi:hypothetical protein